MIHLLFSPLVPTLGKDKGEKRMVKRAVQSRSFKVPSRSSKAEPLGYPKNPTYSLKTLMMTGF